MVLAMVTVAGGDVEDADGSARSTAADPVGEPPRPSTSASIGSAESSHEQSDGSVTPTPGGPAEPHRFVESFDGQPETPTPWRSASWDITVHSRDVETFDVLSAVDAGHGSGCEPPPATHVVTAFESAVFQCKDHVMTAINEQGYGMIYLTPDQLVDFSDGTATIRFDVSTARTSVRDWWDVWITPFDDQLQLPLDLGTDVDANGPPRRAIRVGLGTENQMVAQVFDDFEAVDFGEYPEGQVPGEWWTGYESFLEPDARRRDTFEITISPGHLRVGMPDYDFWWIDADIPELDWTHGVVQLGHHSYNPTKDCNVTNTPRPPIDECTATTWHWDNVVIDPAVPFTILPATERAADAGAPTLQFAEPAPSGAHLRFTAIGDDVHVRFDGGDWIMAEPQATKGANPVDHFTSYWMPVPAGTTSVEFDGEDWFAEDWLVRDASFWSLTAADQTRIGMMQP
jgi:hypothetical protein